MLPVVEPSNQIPVFVLFGIFQRGAAPAAGCAGGPVRFRQQNPTGVRLAGDLAETADPGNAFDQPPGFHLKNRRIDHAAVHPEFGRNFMQGIKAGPGRKDTMYR